MFSFFGIISNKTIEIKMRQNTYAMEIEKMMKMEDSFIDSDQISRISSGLIGYSGFIFLSYNNKNDVK